MPKQANWEISFMEIKSTNFRRCRSLRLCYSLTSVGHNDESAHDDF